MSEPSLPLSRCPFCGARGVLINDPLTLDGTIIDDPYCGVCGKNWPKDGVKPKPRKTRVRPFQAKGDHR